MVEVSNKTLATLLIIAIVVSVAGTLISLQKIGGIGAVTGHAAEDVEDNKEEQPVAEPITGNAVEECENPTEEQVKAGICPVK